MVITESKFSFEFLFIFHTWLDLKFKIFENASCMQNIILVIMESFAYLMLPREKNCKQLTLSAYSW